MQKKLGIFTALTMLMFIMSGCSNPLQSAEANAVLLVGQAQAISSFIDANNSVIYTTRVEGEYKITADKKTAYIPLSLANKLIQSYVIYDISTAKPTAVQPVIKFGDTRAEIWSKTNQSEITIDGTTIPAHYGGAYTIGEEAFVDNIVVISDQLWHQIEGEATSIKIAMCNDARKIETQRSEELTSIFISTHGNN
ncbi:lipoprotein BA_5634 family protein [Culicoidibacter larvae]|uniref:Uncharacterized protein n=1 Tax=Culicoidibacter larvae TaxID=2579976 RepID=A0A5R8Q8W9_9FIRM|nr:lipoprotein BA_5634 family protein [Culicoidibacter larvae]TLG72151.1 hypothetical protein FEZ08_10005 [Culicoidibacter larvae]